MKQIQKAKEKEMVLKKSINIPSKANMEEICKSLDFMSEELNKVTSQQATQIELFNEVRQLKNLMKERDKIINGLERRFDDLEQYSRMEGVISGLDTKLGSYAGITAGDREGEDAPIEDGGSLEG